MRRPVLVPALAVAVALLDAVVVAPDAHAFCRSSACRSTAANPCETDDDGCSVTGAKLFWPTSCIGYTTNELGTQFHDPADTRAVIEKAFRNWSEVACPAGGIASLTFEEREPVACKRSGYDQDGPNVNVVLFQDDDWKYRSIDATLAKTSVTYNDVTGEIYDADIEVNSAFNEITITDDPEEVQYDLLSILTHEIGHFVGLAHSPDSTAVMYASYEPGSMGQRALMADDIAAVCTVYPPNSGVVCNPEPRGGFTATCPEAKADTGTCATATPLAGGQGEDGSAHALSVIGAVSLVLAGRRMHGRRRHARA